MRILGISKRGDRSGELMFGAFALLAFIGALDGSMHDGYSSSELFVIFCSLAVALCYLSQILDWWKKKPK
jgi:hypothetical protein